MRCRFYGDVHKLLFLGKKKWIYGILYIKYPILSTSDYGYSRQYAKIPEEVRQDYQINIKKFDVLLWGLVTNYDIKQNEIEKAFLKHGNSIRSLEKLREKVEEARTITKDLAILSVPVVREKR